MVHPTVDVLHMLKFGIQSDYDTDVIYVDRI